MTRLMSVSLTADAVIQRRKTVTRRKGWAFLKPGDRLTLCRKVMGRKPGEPLERLAEVEVVDISHESLLAVIERPGDVAREGFPEWTPLQFIQFFTDHMGGEPQQLVRRIEWRYR